MNCWWCGKPSDNRRSFNTPNGVRYLCSDKCEKESRNARIAIYQPKMFQKEKEREKT